MASISVVSSPMVVGKRAFFRRDSISKGSCWMGVPVPNKGMRVMAMGVAKYKGTVMREKQLTEMIEKKVMEAREVCESDEISDECKVAWDEVEELSQAKADLRMKLERRDPLEFYCQQNPDTDECRLYEE